MPKFDGILICSDFDGTLTNDKGQISQQNAEAIKYFQENGGKFTFATGRFMDYHKQFSDKIKPNCPVISGNGTTLFDNEKNELIESVNLARNSSDILKFIWEKIPSINQIGFCDYKNAIENLARNEEISAEEYFMETKKLNSYEELEALVLKHQEILVRHYFTQKIEHTFDNMELLKENFSDKYDIFISWNAGIECLPKGINKGYMVQKLQKHLGDVKTTICVGDYDNDISMFAVADLSFAVENAPERVKNHASKIAPHHNENAIEYIIKSL